MSDLDDEELLAKLQRLADAPDGDVRGMLEVVGISFIGGLSGADLEDLDLSGMDMTGVDLSKCSLARTILHGASLRSARLSGSDLSDADLSGADLTGADLSGSLLIGTKFIGAKLSGADLTGAALAGVDWTGADLTGVRLSHELGGGFDQVDLQSHRDTLSQQVATGGLTAAAVAATTGSTGDDTIKIVEEKLTVGKRVVNRGSARVRTYVVETPVEEHVTLRNETVRVERRPVTDDRPVTDADFQERSLEMRETDEEAVVGKTARVVEEIGLRKEVSDRVETVRDTVRRTEVEIQDTTDVNRTAGSTGVAGSMGTSGSNPPGTMASRAVDMTLGTNISGANPAGGAPDGTPGNPPGTEASRAVDKTLGTNVSGANPTRRA